MDDGLFTDDFDISCALAIFCAGGVEGAAHFDLAFIAAFEEDLAFFVFAEGSGLEGAGVIDHGAHHVGGAVGGHDDGAAIGGDGAFVESGGFCCFAVDGEVQFAVGVRGEGEGIRCSENCGAAGIGDGAAVFYFGCMESHQTPFGLDGSFVDDFSIRNAAQAESAGAVSEFFHEIILHLGSGGHQAPYVDGGVFTDNHAVGVHQEHVAIGKKAAVNDGLLIAGDPVQGQGVFSGLLETDGFVLSYAEAGPVHGQASRILANGHFLPVLGDGAGTGTDDSAFRHGIHAGCTQRKGRHDQKGQCLFPMSIVVHFRFLLIYDELVVVYGMGPLWGPDL